MKDADTDPAISTDYYAGSKVAVIRSSPSARQAVRERLTPDSNGVVFAMVGLPARGKSFISRKVERFMQWRGLSTRMFNVGMYRRDATAPEESGRSEFFDAGNAAARGAREAAASAALSDALDFLDDAGEVAILDATNSTVARRRSIKAGIDSHDRRYSLIFIEVICEESETLEANMMNKVSNSPDFKHLSMEEALADLKSRISKYEAVYETVQDDEGPSIKLFDLSSKVMAHQCYGRISRSIVPYLMSIHIGSRPIWLMRALPGDGNPQSPTGSDRLSELSAEGRFSAQALAAFVEERAALYWGASGREREPTQVFTSTMTRAVASAGTLEHQQMSVLNPIDKGTVGAGWWDVECEGDTPPWDELERRQPEVCAQWRKDPLRSRFPGGESYMDVVRRLEGFLMDVEMCTRPVLIVSHITVLQLLLSYFNGSPIEDAWRMSVPKSTVIEVTPSMGGGFMCDSLQLGEGSRTRAPSKA